VRQGSLTAGATALASQRDVTRRLLAALTSDQQDLAAMLRRRQAAIDWIFLRDQVRARRFGAALRTAATMEPVAFARRVSALALSRADAPRSTG
jgi:hypothetical protein